MDVREKLVEIIQNSVGGCARHWEEVIADGLIAHGVTVQKWIPVTERLPDKPDRYLCNVKAFSFPDLRYFAILKYDDGGFIEGKIYTDDVTHWMPLPPAPKGE